MFGNVQDAVIVRINLTPHKRQSIMIHNYKILFLADRNGEVVERLKPTEDMEKVNKCIEALL